MKYFTRTMNVYRYTFGKPSISEGTIYDMAEYKSSKRLSKRAIEEKGRELGNLTYLGMAIEKATYRMTADAFLQNAELVETASESDYKDNTNNDMNMEENNNE